MSLDIDLRGVVRIGDPGFSWQRLPFFFEMRGRANEMFIAQSQSSLHNAREASEAAAWGAFKVELTNDQALHRMELQASSGDRARRRALCAQTLQDRSRAPFNWKLWRPLRD